MLNELEKTKERFCCFCDAYLMEKLRKEEEVESNPMGKNF